MNIKRFVYLMLIPPVLLAQYTPPSGSVTGGSCTNQVATAIASSSASPTCSSVTNAMLAGSIDLTAKVTGILPTANGGGNVLLGSCLTASTSATLDFVGLIDSTYRSYELRIYNLVAATNSTAILLQVGSGGTFVTGSGSYSWQELTTTGATANSASDTSISIVNNAGNPPALSGYIQIFNASGATVHKPFIGAVYNDTVGWSISGRYLSASTFTDIRIKAGSGNLTSGVVCLKGIQ